MSSPYQVSQSALNPSFTAITLLIYKLSRLADEKQRGITSPCLADTTSGRACANTLSYNLSVSTDRSCYSSLRFWSFFDEVLHRFPIFACVIKCVSRRCLEFLQLHRFSSTRSPSFFQSSLGKDSTLSFSPAGLAYGGEEAVCLNPTFPPRDVQSSKRGGSSTAFYGSGRSLDFPIFNRWFQTLISPCLYTSFTTFPPRDVQSSKRGGSSRAFYGFGRSLENHSMVLNPHQPMPLLQLYGQVCLVLLDGRTESCFHD